MAGNIDESTTELHYMTQEDYFTGLIPSCHLQKCLRLQACEQFSEISIE